MRNAKVGYSHFTIYHCGPNRYEVEDTNTSTVVATAEHLSGAMAQARRAKDLEDAEAEGLYEWCGPTKGPARAGEVI